MASNVTVKIDGMERYLRAMKEMRDAINRCAEALEALHPQEPQYVVLQGKSDMFSPEDTR